MWRNGAAGRRASCSFVGRTGAKWTAYDPKLGSVDEIDARTIVVSTENGTPVAILSDDETGTGQRTVVARVVDSPDAATTVTGYCCYRCGEVRHASMANWRAVVGVRLAALAANGYARVVGARGTPYWSGVCRFAICNDGAEVRTRGADGWVGAT
jgi:hypothetical protein